MRRANVDLPLLVAASPALWAKEGCNNLRHRLQYQWVTQNPPLSVSQSHCNGDHGVHLGVRPDLLERLISHNNSQK